MPPTGYLKSIAPSKAAPGGDGTGTCCRGSFLFHWRVRGKTKAIPQTASESYDTPPGCEVITGGGAEPPCAQEIVDCKQFELGALRNEGRCVCQSCHPVSHCATQASDGNSCFCDVCEEGYVTTIDGYCAKPTTASLSVTSSMHDLGAKVALSPDGRYHLSTFDNAGHGNPQPGRMQSASCKPPGGPEKIFVAWDSTRDYIFAEGYLTELELGSDGKTTTLVSNRQLPTCEEMGDGEHAPFRLPLGPPCPPLPHALLLPHPPMADSVLLRSGGRPRLQRDRGALPLEPWPRNLLERSHVRWLDRLSSPLREDWLGLDQR